MLLKGDSLLTGLDSGLQHHRIDAVPSDWRGLLLPGQRITALVHDPEAYYHTEASLVFDDGSVLKATADEHCLAHLFDCYSLRLAKTNEMPGGRTALTPEFEINEVYALIRDEWLLPATEIEGETIGNNPHIQDSGPPGSAPQEASASATLLAGALLVGQDDRRIAVVTAEDIPLNVEIVTDPTEFEAVLAVHSCRLLS